MRTDSILLPLLLLAGLVSTAGTDQAKPFKGVWVARFKGAVICTLEIEDNLDGISGASKACNISVDQNGDLIEGGGPDGSEAQHPFIGAKIDGQVLRFEEDDDGTPLKFELRLTGEGRADLHFMNAPVTIKPIRFERVAAGGGGQH